MATRVSFQMTGWKELGANLRALPAAMQREKILDVLEVGAEPMRARMEQLAPREPGAPDLADNIGISVANRIGDVGGGRWQARHDEEHAVAVGPAKFAFWGIFQEFGTVHHAAQPFARPAFDGTAHACLSLISQGLWGIIRTVRLLGTMGRNT